MAGDTGYSVSAFDWEAFDTAQPASGTTSATATASGDGPVRASSRVLALDTVADFVAAARQMVQDTVPAYRYADTEFVFALNAALLEARRLRPDLFTFSPATQSAFFTAADDTRVPVPPSYRMTVLFYVCGFVQLRDDETNQDSRAASFMTRFTTQMLTLTA